LEKPAAAPKYANVKPKRVGRPEGTDAWSAVALTMIAGYRHAYPLGAVGSAYDPVQIDDVGSSIPPATLTWLVSSAVGAGTGSATPRTTSSFNATTLPMPKTPRIVWPDAIELSAESEPTAPLSPFGPVAPVTPVGPVGPRSVARSLVAKSWRCNEPSLTLPEVTAFLRSCVGPTEFFGSLVAAYAPPPRAMNRASVATTLAYLRRRNGCLPGCVMAPDRRRRP
jgi:hypothetical protein